SPPGRSATDSATSAAAPGRWTSSVWPPGQPARPRAAERRRRGPGDRGREDRRLVLRQVTFAPSPAERSSWLASTVIRRCGAATSRIDGWRQARRAPAERVDLCLTCY